MSRRLVASPALFLAVLAACESPSAVTPAPDAHRERPDSHVENDAGGGGVVSCRDLDGDSFFAHGCGSGPEDCDDLNARVYPGAFEICDGLIDHDCDPETVGGRDLDQDGSYDRACCNLQLDGTVLCGRDCDDTHFGTRDGASEICNDVDDDCDGTVDEGFLSGVEICDGIDNDCDGGADSAEDLDGDGYAPIAADCLGRGDPGAPPSAFPRTDCDDARPQTNPGAADICGNGIDEDCSGQADDGPQWVCRDFDGDAHGSPQTLVNVPGCIPDAGFVSGSSCDDCNDTNPRVFPGRAEVCDRIDNDCSNGGGIAPEEDVDMDGFAAPGACVAGEPGEAVLPATDCDDSDRAVNPDALELCDGLDSDCSSGGYTALDEDGDGDAHAPVGSACVGEGERGAPAWVYPEDDCDDDRADSHGGLTGDDDIASCDGADNDCDPSTSELTMQASCEATGRGGFCGSGGECEHRGEEIVGLAAGNDHTCAWLAGGTVRCWGARYPETGPGVGGMPPAPTALDAIPAPVIGLEGVIEVAAGYSHTCARTVRGNVLCWGWNEGGQLGDGTRDHRGAPVQVSGLGAVIQVAAAHRHTCALQRNGTVWCWGNNTRYQLGDGSSVTRAHPARVSALPGSVSAIAVGHFHGCAVSEGGAVHCWGMNDFGQVGDGTREIRPTPVEVAAAGALSVAAGTSHTCAVMEDGRVRCWGRNGDGQLGNGTTVDSATPVTVEGLDDVVAIEAGANHVCARRSDGSIWCWGDGDRGQLGTPAPTDSNRPHEVPALRGASMLALGEDHTCALIGARIHCLGMGANGQLGDGTLVSRETSAPAVGFGATRVAAGGRHSCALVSEQLAYCWGGVNDSGYLGTGAIQPEIYPSPIVNVAGAVNIDAGGNMSCLLRGDGRVACWGRQALGPTQALAVLAPTDVGAVDARQVAVGESHACILRMDGSVHCWGTNSRRELGDTTRVAHDVPPMAVLGLPGPVRQVSAGKNRTCVVLLDGAVWCWGENRDPELVPGLTAVEVAAGGSSFACARDAGLAVWCWGDNSSGQLGDGTTSARSTPSRVPGIAGALQIDAGLMHACARLESGEIWCWGRNDEGQLGDGTVGVPPLLARSPVRVQGVTDAVDLALGNLHTCARTASNHVLCWGANSPERLGVPPSSQTRVPAPAVVWHL